MKRNLICFCFLLFAFQAVFAQPKREVRAVWLTTNYGLDWPVNKYWGTAAKDLMITMLDRLQDANFNTVIFQVQCLGDVFWDSKIQPWSKIATGKYGQAPTYNICEFVVNECHKRGMEVHAWIVPYRLGTQANADGYDGPTSKIRHVTKLRPELCLQGTDEAWYLDPGLPETRKYLIELYEELVTTTNFDAINLDYTRYPDAKIIDDESFAKYNPDGLSKDDWRRNNVSQFVYELYDMMKKHKPTMKLGTAPIGTYKNVPGRGNLEAYGDVFQDACEWMKQEKHDLLIPQMYWTEEFGYSENMDVWIDNSAARQLVIGLAAYKMTDYNKWEHTVLTDQIEKARAKGTNGVCFFRTDNVVGTGTATKYDEVKKLYAALKDDYFKYPAHIPTMDYNGVTKPNAPANATLLSKDDNVYEISWNTPALDDKNTPIKYYCVYAQKGNSIDIEDAKNIVGYGVVDNNFTFTAPDNDKYAFAVTTFDNGYYESEAALMGTVGIDNVNEAISRWSVSNKTLTVKSNKNIKTLSIYNSGGVLVGKNDFSSQEISISLDGYAKGIYIAIGTFEDGSIEQYKLAL